MAFQISPGVNVSEIDLTTIVPAVSTTEGGVVGQFNWGPVNQRVLIDSEFTLVNTFSKPDANTAADFYTAASFLAYGNQLWVVRGAPNGGSNANASGTDGIVVNNEDNYKQTYEESGVTNGGNWVARYPGKLGNSLKVSVCGDATAWESTLGSNVYAFSGSDKLYADQWVLGLTTDDTIGGASAANLAVTFSYTGATSGTSGTFSNSDILILEQGTPLKDPDGINVSYTKATFGIWTNASGNTIDQVYLLDKGAWYNEPTRLLASATLSGEISGNTGLPGVVVGADYSIAIGADYGANVVFSNTALADFDSDLIEGDLVVLGDLKKMYEVSTSNNTTITLKANYDQDDSANASPKRRWEYYNFFDAAPGTSTFATARGGSNDELHVVVTDEDGDWTQVKDEVLERYSNLSKAIDARTEDGATNYYKNAINNTSKYIWWGNHLTSLGAGNNTDGRTAFSVSTSSPITESLSAGADGAGITNAARIAGYELFRNAEEVDVSIILAGPADIDVSSYIIENVCETRKDCVVCISPPKDSVVENNATPVSEQEDIIEFRNGDGVTSDGLPSSSYGILDSGWKYQYDRYNDLYRWVPLNGDIGGLMVRTDETRDPWFSPAGYNRGTIRNVVKLAYNPAKASRDQLYKNGINPVVSFPGQGTVLFGDKTLLKKPSAFDRINVRRLFIVLEKAIATAAQFSLFEFNDAFTRAQFKNLIEPFLRDVQGRRGIYDFRVVCDETNNTPEVIDRNQFIGDIYIKPARSINFIQLNFVAVRTGVEFDEIVGRF